MLQSLSIRCDGEQIWLLDQQSLPALERWIDASAPGAMVAAIRALQVRGAPAIGVAAALCLACYARSGAAPDAQREAAAALRAARPTAVNLAAALAPLAPHLPDAAALWREAEALFRDDVALCEAMATHGVSLIQPGESILTHCNTGGLATAGVGTALGVLRLAHARGLRVHVWVDETRPLLQGARLTAWELDRLGVPFTLICDGMAASLMAAGRVQRVMVGADRVAVNGDFANKIGTYGLAVLARFHGIPFHVVAPSTTFDAACPDGRGIPIESRPPDEVRGYADARWAPADAPVYNPAFDVTPGGLVSTFVTEHGVGGPEIFSARSPSSAQSR